jgi:NAD(P)H dehydrogenase (quinone)
MNILQVYAHDEPSSMTATLKNIAAQILQEQGHTVVISDLYAQGFNPVAARWDFITSSGEHYNYEHEQQHASRSGATYSVDIVGEIQKLQAADLILFHFPMWWHSAPAMMKGWFDRIMAKGIAWEDGRIFEHGMLKGKSGMLVVSTGDPGSYYAVNGKYRMTVEQALHPINHGILALSGMNVLEPFVIEGLRGIEQVDLDRQLEEYKTTIENIVSNPRYISTFI